jgi:hypothetical protein
MGRLLCLETFMLKLLNSNSKYIENEYSGKFNRLKIYTVYVLVNMSQKYNWESLKYDVWNTVHNVKEQYDAFRKNCMVTDREI